MAKTKRLKKQTDGWCGLSSARGAAREWTMALATKCANTTRRIAGALLGSLGHAVIWRMSLGNASTEKQADTSEKPALFRVQGTRNISSFLVSARAGRAAERHRRLCPEESRRKENDMCRTTCMETIAQAARERREARLREMMNTNYGNEPTVVVRYGK